MKNYCGREAALFEFVAAGDTTIIHYSLFIIHFYFAYPVNLTRISADRMVTVVSGDDVRKISL